MITSVAARLPYLLNVKTLKIDAALVLLGRETLSAPADYSLNGSVSARILELPKKAVGHLCGIDEGNTLRLVGEKVIACSFHTRQTVPRFRIY